MFGIGTQEILILGLVCPLVLGVPVVIVLAVLWFNKRSSHGGSDASVVELQAEVRRLQGEIERLKKG